MREWQAFQRIYGPIGQRRDDYLAALIAQAVRNALATPAVPIDDFIPKWDEREQDEQGAGDGDDGS